MSWNYSTRMRCLTGLLLVVFFLISLVSYFKPDGAKILVGIGVIPVVGIMALMIAMRARRQIDVED